MGEYSICITNAIIFVTNERFMLEQYPVKVLIAFGETFEENDQILQWLLENGYPELAALSSTIRGSEEAMNWLMKNGFPQLGALDAAIDGKEQAKKWLIKNNYLFLAVFSDACRKDPVALKHLKENELELFIRLAQKIYNFRNNQEWDYHKIHF